jgi:hypothetical protein
MLQRAWLSGDKSTCLMHLQQQRPAQWFFFVWFAASSLVQPQLPVAYIVKIPRRKLRRDRLRRNETLERMVKAEREEKLHATSQAEQQGQACQTRPTAASGLGHPKWPISNTPRDREAVCTGVRHRYATARSPMDMSFPPRTGGRQSIRHVPFASRIPHSWRRPRERHSPTLRSGSRTGAPSQLPGAIPHPRHSLPA